MTVPVVDPAVLLAQLTQSRAAYHDLMTGNMARVTVDQNGERVEFTAANANSLLAYIQRLEAQLCGGATASRPHAIGFFF